MKVMTLAAVAAVALFAGLAAGAAYYSFVLGETEARHQSLVKELRDENARLQNLLTQTNNQLSRLQSDYRSLQTQLENAETRARQLNERLASLERRADSLSSQLSSTSNELSKLRTKVDQVKNIMTLLENDRVLISWLRGGAPDDREGARQYWNETRALALKSDPNLVNTVDEILANLNLYFDWLARAPPLTGTSRAEIIAWCPLWIDWLINAPPGVDGYSEAVERFSQEVMLVVIGHIDSLMRVLES
ncbi:MAG: hypothetical protein RMK31_00055 [Candidatus Caldarchaeum sp.]|nr:hypothetical protein [Candidatus Caldarchaeum sp.]